MNFLTRDRSIFAALAAAMLITRLHHFDIVPDASWAVFFIGGLYLRSAVAFAGLMVEAVAVDYIATQHLGVSTYCLSPAYVFLLPAYGTLWLGGAWTPPLSRIDRVSVGITFGGLLIASVSLCFLISNGSFYWLSGRATSPTISGWLANFAHWYPHFLTVPCAYVCLAMAVHLSLRRLLGVRHGAARAAGS